MIETDGSEYALPMDGRCCDYLQFKPFQAEAREAPATDCPADAARLLRQSPHLWHGRALHDVRTGAWLCGRAEPLEDCSPTRHLPDIR